MPFLAFQQRPSYGGGGQFSNGFGNSPNNLNAMRNNNNSFGARGGPPLNQFAGNPPPFPQQGQRPPPGDFSRGGGGFSGNQGYGYQGQGQSQVSDPALRAIEEARNEVQELEAKKLRKRTMSSEEYAPAPATTSAPTPTSTAAPVGQTQAQDRDFNHHRDQQGQAQGFRRDNYPQQGQGQGLGQDNRWGGPQRGGPDDYHHNNNNNSNGNFYGAGHGSQGGYGYGGESQRVPYRTRGPSFDNSGPEGANRSFGTGGNVPLHGQQQYPLDAQHHQHHQVQSEPMWERVKVPMPVQQQPPQFQRLQPPPYGGADPAGDRWNQRQQLPPPPALHMNAHYVNINNPNGSANGVPPSGYRPERERGPRSGNTPREGEADRAAAPAPRAVATASPVVSDRRAASNASPYDPSKSFSSLFGGKAPQEGAYAQQEGQGQSQGHAVSKQDYPLPHEEVIRANRVYNPAPAPEAPHVAAGYQQEQRAFGSPATSGGPRQKMLFDPQSNEYRPLEKDTVKAPYANKVPVKKPECAGPPVSEEAAEDKASVLRKTLQVNRIEQNTSADKWSRGKESAPAAEAASAPARPVHTVRPHTEGNHEETETYEQGRDEYLAERKALRLKERQERGPRTKGFLFRFTADGNIERVLTAEELEAKARKAERAAAPRQTATKRGAEDGSAAARVELTNFDHLDFDNLTKEEFQSLPKAKKEEIRAKHAADKAARRTGGAQDARDGREVREPREVREVRDTRPPRENRLPQYGAEPEELNVGSLNLGYSAHSGGHDHGDLDIQQMARENDAYRSLQPIKAFVPGQGYGGPLDAPPQQPLMQNWREGAQVIPAARVEQHLPHQPHPTHQGHPAHLLHQQHQQLPYPAIIQPHSYPIIHQPHQPVVNLGHDQQSWYVIICVVFLCSSVTFP